MTKREQVIQFLNSKCEESKNNIVSIGKSDLEIINLSEQEVIRILCLLNEDKLIRIVRKSTNDDFSRYWDIALTGDCVDYFDNRKKNNKQVLWEFLKFIVPTILSVIALLKSFLLF